MEILHNLYLWSDAILIAPYRLTRIPILGYFMGTFCLASLCVILGQLTLSMAFRSNRKWLHQDSRQMVRMHNLSLRALVAKDKSAYKACNKEANDAFGKYFFAHIALSISSLWPVPFALGWLQTRFAAVDFELPFRLPVVGDSVGYSFTFIPVYILIYILFGKLKHRLPLFKRMAKWIHSDVNPSEKMISLEDLTPGKPTT